MSEPVSLPLGAQSTSSQPERRFFEYVARGVPYGPDDGTIAPVAALASVPFAPAFSLSAVRHYLDLYPEWTATWRLPSGFNRAAPGADARGWVSEGHYGLDQGLALQAPRHRRRSDRVELGQAFARLGSRVTLVQDEPMFLGHEERDAAQLLSDALARDGIEIHLDTQTIRVRVAGNAENQFPHIESVAARIVVTNALFLGRERLSAEAIPWCTFTDPEIAHVGMYVTEARQKGIPVKTFTVLMPKSIEGQSALSDPVAGHQDGGACLRRIAPRIGPDVADEEVAILVKEER
jgi:Putative glucoamylase/Pyridine nucleotide-disulphide oxidoreductase/Pyridine nucleotide-disulphide oxidoreductase, dimerisation domain